MISRTASERNEDQANVQRVSNTPGAGDAEEAAHGTKPTQSSQIVKLAQKDYRFGNSLDGVAFAVPLAGPHRALLLNRGRGGFVSAISAKFYEVHGKVPSTNAVNDALRLLHYFCELSDPEPVALRSSGDTKGVVLDLGWESGEVTMVRPGRWEILSEGSALFRRTRLSQPLPAPIRGGRLDLLREMINCTEQDWSLLRAVLVAALIPSIPHPIVAFTGEQGTGKTTAMRFCARALDPGRGGNRAIPRQEDDWIVAANASYVVGLDNVSVIYPWLSDALCRASTGAAWVKRELYSDAEPTVLEVRRAIFLNGIDLGSVRGDLADRLVLVELDQIAPDQRRTDEELEFLFGQSHAEILGGLLDLAAEVLRRLDVLKPSTLPRMADFARIVAGVDDVCGSRALDFYLHQRGSLDRAVLESDRFGAAVREWLDQNPETEEMLAGEVLRKINAGLPTSPPTRDWPSTPGAAAGHLRRLAPSLRRLGYRAEMCTKSGRKHQGPLWRLGGRSEQEAPGEHPSEPQGSQASELDQVVGATGDASPPLFSEGIVLESHPNPMSERSPVDLMISRVQMEGR